MLCRHTLSHSSKRAPAQEHSAAGGVAVGMRHKTGGISDSASASPDRFRCHIYRYTYTLFSLVVAAVALL